MRSIARRSWSFATVVAVIAGLVALAPTSASADTQQVVLRCQADPSFTASPFTAGGTPTFTVTATPAQAGVGELVTLTGSVSGWTGTLGPGTVPAGGMRIDWVFESLWGGPDRIASSATNSAAIAPLSPIFPSLPSSASVSFVPAPNEAGPYRLKDVWLNLVAGPGTPALTDPYDTRCNAGAEPRSAPVPIGAIASVQLLPPTLRAVRFEGQDVGVAAVRGAADGFTVQISGVNWPSSLPAGALMACATTGPPCSPATGFAVPLGTSATGALSGVLTVPAGAVTTGYSWLVVGFGAWTAVVDFLALGEPSITLTPSSGGPGTSVSLIGTSFDPGREVFLTPCSTDSGLCLPTSDTGRVAMAGEDGSWTSSMTISDPSIRRIVGVQRTGDVEENWAQDSASFTFVQPGTVTTVTAPTTVAWPAGGVGGVATVEGLSTGSGGSIEVSAYGPDDPTCAGAPVDTAVVPATAPDAGTSTTPISLVLGGPGTYSWVATYLGGVDTPESSSTCGAPGSTTTVSPSAGTLSGLADAAQVEVGAGITDVATLSDVTADATGTITFTVHDNSTCTNWPWFTDTVAVDGPGSYVSSPFTPSTIGHYWFRAVYSGDARNGGASTPCSSPDQAFDVVSVPDAPWNLGGTYSSQTLYISWNAPASTGGLPLDGYVVTVLPAGDTQFIDAGTTSVVLGGLTNGVPVTISIQAVNAVGESEPLLSPELFPSTKPDAPATVAAVAGDGQATVSWTAPPSDGGAQVSGYRITNVQSGDSSIVNETVTSIVVDQLVNGTAYEFDVEALNWNGFSPTRRTAPVTPLGAPAAPSDVSAVARGDASILVSWPTVTSTGGAALTGYDVRIWDAAGSSASATVVRVANPAATTRRFAGLDLAKQYLVGVRATNSAGRASAWRDSSVPVSPATYPGAPSTVVATPTATGLEVSWNPSADGGAEIDRYRITATDVGTGAALAPKTFSATSTQCRSFASATPVCTFGGLTAGATYRFVVEARNTALLWSAVSSPSAPTVMATVPGRPAAPVASAFRAAAVVTWTPPTTDGAAPITSYRIEVFTGTTPVSTVDVPAGGPTSVTIRELINGVSYRFKVSATNAVGRGVSSVYSNTVKPTATRPAAP